MEKEAATLNRALRAIFRAVELDATMTPVDYDWRLKEWRAED